MIVVLVLLLACDFFGNVPKADVLLMPFCLFGLIKHKSYLCKDINKYIFILLFGFILSMLSCYYFRGQNLWESIQALRVYWLICFFLYIYNKNIMVDKIENGLCLFYYIYVVAYLLRLTFPSLKIGLFFDDGIDGEHTNITILGFFILPFGFFYYLNKALDKVKIKYIILAMFSMFIWFNMGSRTNIIGGLLVSVFMYFNYYSINKKNMHHIKFLLIIIIILGAFSQIPMVQSSLKFIMDKVQNGSNLDNDNYIRVQQFYYFTHNHFKNIFEYFLGSGMPHGNSAYGQRMLSHGEIGGIVTGWYDWGVIGLSWVVGLFTVLTLLCMYIKISFTKIPQNYLYIRAIYLFYLLSAPFAILSFEGGAFVFQSYLLYIYCKKRIL